MNWPLDEFTGKDVIFVGAGKGRAMVGIENFLRSHAQIKSFTGVDKVVGDQPLGFLRTYDNKKTVFVKNEGIPGAEMPVAYITPMQLFFSLVPLTGATTIGITGSKGKSTTTALTAHMLERGGKKVILAGNIGISPLTALDSATKDTFFVLELSSYQLSDMRVSPHISACTNLYNDHTDWHGSLAEYWEAKHNIVRYSTADDVFVYNPDFTLLRDWAKTAKCRSIAIDPNEKLDLSKAHLFGGHNRLDALIARQIARECGVTDDVCQAAINTFKPLSHRMQVVATKNDVTYIDDAIGMTPESTLAGLKAISEKFGPIGCLLLGGQDRNYDFAELMQKVAESRIPNLVLFPNTEAKMKTGLPESYHPDILETTSMNEAVAFAAKHAPTGSVVLLSTAAPSYLLWKDFEDKGDQFQAAVRGLE
jgi:UDP-N-acetylmuramoylalanine--D-glutamate ligase